MYNCYFSVDLRPLFLDVLRLGYPVIMCQILSNPGNYLHGLQLGYFSEIGYSLSSAECTRMNVELVQLGQLY